MSLAPQLRRRRRSKNGQQGQGLVEFALVFPIFWAIIIALIEFSFAFHAVLAVSFASRNAAVIAAEATNFASADCSILHSIEGDMGAPSIPNQIKQVDISWTDANGVVKGSPTTYTRVSGSPLNCNVNGLIFTLPYNQTANGYPYTNRCASRAGCGILGGTNHPGVDTIEVKITYLYPFHTPYGTALGGTGWTLTRSSDMRMEPFQ